MGPLNANELKSNNRALLDIIPLGPVNEMAVAIVAAGVQTLLGLNTDIQPPAANPDYAYIPGRSQFDASKILKSLSAITDGSPFKLGLIAHDLCTPILSFIYGESQLGGKVALVSMHRLFAKDPEVTYQRIIKISLHEIGHLMGIGHCWEKTCIMHFSRDLEALDFLSEYYCPACEYEVKRRLKTFFVKYTKT